jgi:hypothetical protein
MSTCSRLTLVASAGVIAGALWPPAVLVAFHIAALYAGIWIVRTLE